MHESEALKTVPDFFQAFQLDTKSRDERLTTMGGSDITTLAEGNPEKIARMYAQKTGQVQPDDLSMVWPVVMGHVTETLNTEWTAHKLGLPIIDRQRVLRGEKHKFMRCTLDGVIAGYKNRQAVYDAKFTMGRPQAGEDWRDVIPRLTNYYSAQLHWNAYLLEEATGKTCPYGVLSFIRGGNEPVICEVKISKKYQAELIGKASYFMGCIEMGIEPTDLQPAEAPVPAAEKVPVNMTDTTHSVKWKHYAEIWAQTFGAADSFKKAETELKKMVPRHASVAHGNGIKIRVAANNSKRIEVQKND